MTPPALRDLLSDSLALWGVDGRATVAADGVIVATGEIALLISPADAGELPIRWWVTRDGHRRPCPSVLGLLRTLRNALGLPGSPPLRLRVASSA